MIRALYVFYKDLNLHPGLRSMAKTYSFLPYFLWSEHLNQDVDDTPSLQYRMSLAKRFNDTILPERSQLLMGSGDIDEIIAICKLHQLSEVVMLRHFEPREKAYQLELGQSLNQEGVMLSLLDEYTAVPIEKTLKKDGTPYIKFTPYYHNWRSKLSPRVAAYSPMHWLDQPLPFVPLFDLMQSEIEQDLKHFTHFLLKTYPNYLTQRDYPYLNGTSRASALLNHGGISVHDVISHLIHLTHDGEQAVIESVEGYIRQVAWRDFYLMLADQFPESLTDNFNKRYNIPWINNAMDYQMWCAGQTGYPFLDAAMLHLFHTGRMHNRLRMLVASFLTKDLLIDWRWGADWFKEHLIDYDLASNVGGWQWAASTGADAVPYFRIFNPTKQSEQYDPLGVFIKSEVEMLCEVDSTLIHQPLRYGIPYIVPCIDHKFARDRVLAVNKNFVTKT